MSKEYKEGFKDGFKEGWKAALKQSKIVDYPVMPTVPPAQWPTYALDGCPICGKKGVHASVCYHPKCPTKVTATTGAIGAAGSATEFYGAGANGAAGY